MTKNNIESPKPQTVVIIEPSDIIRRGLSDILQDSSNFSIIGIYDEISDYENNPPSINSDLVILNPSLVSYGKRGALRSRFNKNHLIALIYNYIDKETLNQFDDILDVNDPASKIIRKLNNITEDNTKPKNSADLGDLSDRELEILVAVAKGMINKEIADRYNISIHTVIAHRKNISRKTGIKSVSGFVVYALLNNLIEEHEVI